MLIRRFCKPFGRISPRLILPKSISTVNVAQSVEEEKQDVASTDRLLKMVRERANPAYHNIMPLRTPILWSEALLNAAPKSSPSPSQHTNSSPTEDMEPPTPRTMPDSYSELILPFGSDSQLLEQYMNAAGGIRMGKLMEHLDSLAGSISYKHMLGPSVQTLGAIHERGFYIVTASVDRLDMLAPLNPARDLRISGQVIYTGHSSMEVAVKMESIGKDEPEETVLLGRFSMVCRDASTHRARKVNPLVINTPDERALHALGEQMKQRRTRYAQRSLSRVPPTSTEAAGLHSFFLQYGQEDLNAVSGKETVPQVERVWIGDTQLEKCMLMFPQERNVHQKVFGGYLMRLAYELGFANASLFTRGPVRFLSLDGISFAQPVPIGSILRLTSLILHTSTSPTEENSMVVVSARSTWHCTAHIQDMNGDFKHVGVKANVVDVKTGLEQTTNDFRFTWCQVNPEGQKLRVVPKTYAETMLWLEGKRALDLGNEIRGLRTA